MSFEVKDSGKREEFISGMVRDTAEGKVDYTLVLDGPMFERWATHLTRGAVKYDKRNWMKARGEAELSRFRESALRHFIAYLRGDEDEDHAAGVFFNINGVEYVKTRLEEAREEVVEIPHKVNRRAPRPNDDDDEGDEGMRKFGEAFLRCPDEEDG